MLILRSWMMNNTFLRIPSDNAGQDNKSQPILNLFVYLICL